jgi:hypothetical protein
VAVRPNDCIPMENDDHLVQEVIVIVMQTEPRAFALRAEGIGFQPLVPVGSYLGHVRIAVKNRNAHARPLKNLLKASITKLWSSSLKFSCAGMQRIS